MSESDSSLSTLFNTALSLRTSLDSLAATTDEYSLTLNRAISTFEECQQLASSVALFSPNESLDDIASSDLQFLSIDYYLGDLIPRATSSGPTAASSRKTTVAAAQQAYGSFLSLLEDYELLSVSDRRLYAHWSANNNAFSVLSGSDQAAKREAKITRFKQEKELTAQLELLQTSTSNSKLIDDDVVRNLRLAELALHIHLTFHSLDLLAQEHRILAMAPTNEQRDVGSAPDERHRGRRDYGYSDRLDPSFNAAGGGRGAGPILNAQGKPLQPFTLLDSRRNVREGVFRPDHRLPTMSIDEYLDEERRRGGMIEGGGEPVEVEPNEDDLEAADKETIKKREWDEFVEANPKGSGNTLNRG